MNMYNGYFNQFSNAEPGFGNTDDALSFANDTIDILCGYAPHYLCQTQPLFVNNKLYTAKRRLLD